MMISDSHPTVSIIIVTFNSREDILECLNSLDTLGEVSHEIYVVDNASTDGTPEVLRDYASGKENVKLILNSENYGLAFANNQPMQFCRGKYILILNPDTLVHRGAIRAMVDFMERFSSVGVVGPKTLWEDGSPQSSYQHGWTLFHLFIWRLLPTWLPRFTYDRIISRYRQVRVAWVSGGCLLIRRSLYKDLKGYDTNYFVVIEDVVDLCKRVRQKGFDVVFLPSATITHAGGKSSKTVKGLTAYRIYEGDIYHFFKYGGFLKASLVKFVLMGNSVLRGLVALLLTPLNSQKFADSSRRYFQVAKLLSRTKIRDLGGRLPVKTGLF